VASAFSAAAKGSSKTKRKRKEKADAALKEWQCEELLDRDSEVGPGHASGGVGGQVSNSSKSNYTQHCSRAHRGCKADWVGDRKFIPWSAVRACTNQRETNLLLTSRNLETGELIEEAARVEGWRLRAIRVSYARAVDRKQAYLAPGERGGRLAGGRTHECHWHTPGAVGEHPRVVGEGECGGFFSTVAALLRHIQRCHMGKVTCNGGGAGRTRAPQKKKPKSAMHTGGCGSSCGGGAHSHGGGAGGGGSGSGSDSDSSAC